MKLAKIWQFRVYPSAVYKNRLNAVAACELEAASSAVEDGETLGRSRHRWKQTVGGDKSQQNNAAMRKLLNTKIWHALAFKDWVAWESNLTALREAGVPFDEVTYTLELFGHVISHRHSTLDAYKILNEMKTAKMHPAVVKLNEGLLEAHVELKEIFCDGPGSGWQNLCRLSWQTAVKLQRRRKRFARQYLLSLPAETALKITPEQLHKQIATQASLSVHRNVAANNNTNNSPKQLADHQI